jgi:hypothetical protein
MHMEEFEMLFFFCVLPTSDRCAQDIYIRVRESTYTYLQLCNPHHSLSTRSVLNRVCGIKQTNNDHPSSIDIVDKGFKRTQDSKEDCQRRPS